MKEFIRDILTYFLFIIAVHLLLASMLICTSEERRVTSSDPSDAAKRKHEDINEAQAMDLFMMDYKTDLKDMDWNFIWRRWHIQDPNSLSDNEIVQRIIEARTKLLNHDKNHVWEDVRNAKLLQRKSTLAKIVDQKMWNAMCEHIGFNPYYYSGLNCNAQLYKYRPKMKYHVYVGLEKFVSDLLWCNCITQALDNTSHQEIFCISQYTTTEYFIMQPVHTPPNSLMIVGMRHLSQFEDQPHFLSESSSGSRVGDSGKPTNEKKAIKSFLSDYDAAQREEVWNSLLRRWSGHPLDYLSDNDIKQKVNEARIKFFQQDRNYAWEDLQKAELADKRSILSTSVAQREWNSFCEEIGFNPHHLNTIKCNALLYKYNAKMKYHTFIDSVNFRRDVLFCSCLLTPLNYTFAENIEETFCVSQYTPTEYFVLQPLRSKHYSLIVVGMKQIPHPVVFHNNN